jgi:putative ATP-dependent endonuclease of OLD family
MYLRKIRIRNFRVFDEIGVEIVFNKRVNAIIGENNGGKSSIIDAIRIAFSTVP